MNVFSIISIYNKNVCFKSTSIKDVNTKSVYTKSLDISNLGNISTIKGLKRYL